jgi:two-component system response regulator MprA
MIDNRVLLVEDDPAVLSAVRRRLLFEGFKVDTAETGTNALEKVTSTSPNLIILDVMLPGLDGIKVAEMVRRSSEIPILMLTARATVMDRVAGLESGADDYLVKPFAIEELLARIRALLRRTRPRAEAATTDVLRFADVTLNSATREVERSNTLIPVTPREFGILDYFMRHPRQVLTRDQIFESVWGSEHMGGSNIIDVYIKSLREKLESTGRSRIIQTVRGVGYALREA